MLRIIPSGEIAQFWRVYRDLQPAEELLIVICNAISALTAESCSDLDTASTEKSKGLFRTGSRRFNTEISNIEL